MNKTFYNPQIVLIKSSLNTTFPKDMFNLKKCGDSYYLSIKEKYVIEVIAKLMQWHEIDGKIAVDVDADPAHYYVVASNVNVCCDCDDMQAQDKAKTKTAINISDADE